MTPPLEKTWPSRHLCWMFFCCIYMNAFIMSIYECGYLPEEPVVFGCIVNKLKHVQVQGEDTVTVFLSRSAWDILRNMVFVMSDFTLMPRSESWLLVSPRGWSSIWGGGGTFGRVSAGGGWLVASPPPKPEASGASGTSTDGELGLPPPTGVSTWCWWFWFNRALS